MAHTLRRGLLLLAATLMLFAAATNAAITVPHLREDLLELHVRTTLLSAIVLGLHFATFAMVGSAALVIAIALGSASYVSVRAPLLAVGASYFSFGLFAFLSSRSPHTLGYVLMGLLVALSALLREPEPTRHT